MKLVTLPLNLKYIILKKKNKEASLDHSWVFFLPYLVNDCSRGMGRLKGEVHMYPSRSVNFLLILSKLIYNSRFYIATIVI